jgi:hypothetical protein
LYAAASTLGGAAFYGYAPGGHAFDGLSDTDEPNFHGMMDSVIGIGGGGGSAWDHIVDDSILIEKFLDSAQQHPEIFGGTTSYDQNLIASTMMDSIRLNPSLFGCTGAGSGPNQWTIYVTDTTYSTYESGVLVGLYTMVGTPAGSLITDSYGKAIFYQPSDNYYAQIYKGGIYMSRTNLTLSADGQVDTLRAWKARIPANAQPYYTALVMNYWTRATGGGLAGTDFVAYNNNVVLDSVHHVYVGPWRDHCLTDFNGNAVIQTPKSYQFNPPTKWKCTLELWKNGAMIWQRTGVSIDDVDTMKVTNRVTP